MQLRRIATTLATLATAAGLTFGTAVAAQADDWGGVTSPNPLYCSDAQPVKSVAFTDRFGNTEGYLDLRWSWSCGIQWARIRSLQPNSSASRTAKHLAVSLHENTHQGNAAGADDYNTASNWTRGIILIDGPSSHVCAYGDITEYDGSHYSAVNCA